MDLHYHKERIIQINALPPRNYYHIENENRIDLKSFRFAYFPKYEERVLQIVPEHTIRVPSNWQILGYDQHQYTNVRYPFPLNPPFIDKDNPCGVYVCSIAKLEKDKRYYLNIDGADSCVYVFVNHQFVGYSTISHCNSEFDITDFLTEEDNELRLIVFKWNAFSYLEDQDKFRMSGLFRDVYLLIREKDHIHHFTLRALYDENTKQGTLLFQCKKNATVTFNHQTQTGNDLVFTIPFVHPWNAEDPFLYPVLIEYQNERIKEEIGFRNIRVDKNVLRLNGQPIKFKGVNRHSSTCDGYVETIDDLKKDIEIMKKHHINAIRTAHYPCHKELPFLCDKEGIYLLEEADVECHGVVYKNGVYDVSHYNDFAEDSMFYDAICYRQEKMVMRDLNRCSILIWSLGNESGWGECFKGASKVISKLDDTRLIHYERSWVGDCNSEPNTFGFAHSAKPYVDIYSRMYPSLEELEEMKGKLDKPLILCEYSHAMGNSCGDLEDYETILENEISFCGGFIWEFINHCIVDHEKLLYGGDFNDFPNDKNFCMDGLVGIDRRLFPEIEDVKQVFSYVKVKKIDTKTYRIYNRKYFTNLTGIYAEIYLEVDGKKQFYDTLDVSSCNPQSYIDYIFTDSSCTSKKYRTLTFIFKDQTQQEIYHKQFILKTIFPLEELKNETLQIQNNQFILNEFIINEEGMICQIGKDNILTRPAKLQVSRAFIDNDREMYWKVWHNFDLENTRFYVTKITPSKDSIAFDGNLSSRTNLIGKLHIEYCMTNLGLKMTLGAKINEEISYLPRFGLSLSLLSSFMKANYIGYGPNESYIDKHQASYFSKHSFDVFSKENLFDYPYPQESGSHYHTMEATILSENSSLHIHSNQPFSFQAIPFEVNEFKDHAYLMNYSTNHCVVNIDYKMSGIGSNSCGPALAKKYQLNEKEFVQEIYLMIDK